VNVGAYGHPPLPPVASNICIFGCRTFTQRLGRWCYRL